MNKLTILGNGYTAQFLSKEALKKGFEVFIVSRNISNPKKNIHYLNFFDSNNVAKNLTTNHIISTIPPDRNGKDPVILKYGKSIASNKSNIIEDISIILKMPKWTFIKALFY